MRETERERERERERQAYQWYWRRGAGKGRKDLHSTIVRHVSKALWCLGFRPWFRSPSSAASSVAHSPLMSKGVYEKERETERETEREREREFTELPTMSLNIFYSGPMGKKVAANWFSLQHAQRINRAFSNLDQDKDGFITKEEFRKLEPGMTDIFVDRIFGEHVNAFNCTSTTSGKSPPKPSLKRRSSVMLMRQEIAKQKISKRGCMSFSDYLTFAMCWNDKRHPYSLKYFFTCLDLERRGFLTHVEIHSFFREVFAKYLENNQYNDIRMEDVRDEIFDMVTQQVPGKITQKDILNSGVQDVLVDVLSDYNGFWRYDNREYLMQMEDEEEQ